MPFPVQPRPDQIDSRGLFVCQDPQLRSSVMPLFELDSEHLDERPIGLGTAFRIDPWSTCATAFHVMGDFLRLDALNQPVLRDHVRVVALEINGVGYGAPRVPDDAWRPISGV